MCVSKENVLFARGSKVAVFRGAFVLQLPLPRYVDRASCSCKIDERIGTMTSSLDVDSATFLVKLRTKAPKPSKHDCVLRGGESVQYVPTLCLNFVFPHHFGMTESIAAGW